MQPCNQDVVPLEAYHPISLYSSTSVSLQQTNAKLITSSVPLLSLSPVQESRSQTTTSFRLDDTGSSQQAASKNNTDIAEVLTETAVHEV